MVTSSVAPLPLLWISLGKKEHEPPSQFYVKPTSGSQLVFPLASDIQDQSDLEALSLFTLAVE